MREENGCCHKTKERSEKEYQDLIHRLNRIEGQVRGIKGMVEKDVYCTDILIQVAAVNAALNSFNKVLLANHIRTCVADDIRQGKEETIDELVAVLQKVMKCWSVYSQRFFCFSPCRWFLPYASKAIQHVFHGYAL